MYVVLESYTCVFRNLYYYLITGTNGILYLLKRYRLYCVTNDITSDYSYQYRDYL